MSDRDLTTSDIAQSQDAADEPTTREQDGSRDSANGDLAQPSAQAGEEQAQSAREPLLPTDSTATFEARWHEIQTGFVDEPRNALREADALVAKLMQELAGSFSQARERLEAQWDSGDDVSTEDLRVALQRYRSFFERLLSA